MLIGTAPSCPIATNLYLDHRCSEGVMGRVIDESSVPHNGGASHSAGVPLYTCLRCVEEKARYIIATASVIEMRSHLLRAHGVEEGDLSKFIRVGEIAADPAMK